jgi:hypothetical protein
MDEVQVNSLAELVSIFEGDPIDTVYRGEPEVPTPLISKIGRISPPKRPHVTITEEKMFSAFCARAPRYLEFSPSNKLEWLAAAQHHWLPTRLLDWTESPLVAAFFAVRRPGNGFVYSTRGVEYLDDLNADPFTLPGPRLIRIPARFDRIHHQLGLFSINPNVVAPFEIGYMRKIRVPAGIRKLFLDAFCKLGITDETLFPGLDGLARYVSWSRGYED